MTGATLFWVGLSALGYVYLGYPLLLALFAHLLRRRPQPGDGAFFVSMIVAAHNEAEVIEAKLRNALDLDYSRDRLELIVVSDASDDGTDEIVAKHQGVVLIRQEQRGGKSAALNRGAEAARGKILVFSDANSMFAPDALLRLTAPLADPRVGAVSGALHYEADATGSGEGLYWRYEQMVKALESKCGRLVGANGAIYAIRRSLYPHLRPLDVNDFRVPYQALLEGMSVVLVPDAIAVERAAPTVGGELARKVRIMSRALPMFFRLLPSTLTAGRPFVAWQLVSHKLLREIQGVFFIAMLGGAIWASVAEGAVGWPALIVQMVGYGLGAMGWLFSPLRRLLPIQLATYVTMIAVASVWALVRWATGGNRATWERTERE